MIQRHQPEFHKRNGHAAGEPNQISSGKKSSNGQKPKPGAAEWFRRFAHKTSEIVGSPWTFFLALLTIIVWAILGPAFGFSDTWQLVINTATTIVTFLMVFLIQNTQNRDAKAIHLKLDELIHAVKGARNKLIDLENCSDEELAEIEEQFQRVKAHQDRSKRRPAQEKPVEEKK